MTADVQAQFDKMDELSLKGKSFFFIIDFLVQNVEIYEQTQLINSRLLIDFPSFTNVVKGYKTDKNLIFKASPESSENYKRGFDVVLENLRRGNSYLTNYTSRSSIETNYTLEELFYASSAKYKVYYPQQFVFFSPETFVEIKENQISTHPMKGTIDATIDNAAEILKNDVKEKAEHYTVVDLLRNDLSIVANDVKVDYFQRIDYIETMQKNLYAMSSEITGNLKPEYRGKIGKIMSELLPAGSILGAPKKKTLEIILEAENYDRKFYTGVCGWFDGENLDSCVMIRFIEEENQQLYFKSGGGITHLSTFENEYEEMKNKIYVPVYRKH